MALVPCKVCGSLNSDEAEICLSCGYPTQGRKRPAIFQWAAILVVILFAIPLIGGLMMRVKSRPNQLPPEPPAAQLPLELGTSGVR